MNQWPLWMQVTDACWKLMWRAVGVFTICAVAPAGVIVGLRLLRAIRPVVAP